MLVQKNAKIILAFVVVLTAAGALYVKSKWEEWTVWPELRKPVLAVFKDPDSALFREQHIGRRAFCGEVNARNGMGGYSGYARFVAAGDRALVEGVGGHGWYGEGKSVQELIDALDKEISLMKSLQRKPTQEEIEQAIFNDVWQARCAAHS